MLTAIIIPLMVKVTMLTLALQVKTLEEVISAANSHSLLVLHSDQ